ncbi:homeodomain mating type protein alpha2 [Pleosporales sp. CAS-2024a]
MACHAADIDDMNEFFDFEQLDRHLGAITSAVFDQQHPDPLDHLGHALPMDWSPGATIPVPSHDHQMHAVFDHPSHFQDARRPLDFASDQVVSLAHTHMGPDCTARTSAAAMSKHTIPCLEPSASSAPLSSSTPTSIVRTSHMAPERLIGTIHRTEAVEQASLPVFTVPEWQMHSDPDPVHLHISPPSSEALPLRQAPVAAWKPASAKRKGPQCRIPLEARQILEDEFVANPYPCSWELDIIAHQANLDIKKVRNWFNNTRARKKDGGQSASPISTGPCAHLSSNADAVQPCQTSHLGCLPGARLSKDSLEALEQQHIEGVQPPQPLAVYLAQSYQQEAINLPHVQAAIETATLRAHYSYDDVWSGALPDRTASVITSVASSDGTAPTSFTISSSGSRSNISSFGRDRRRGRRRMAWKGSPLDPAKFDGVNSAGEPQKDLPFFCTFCARAFKTKYEWVRHEDSVHALRTTWICCDTKMAPLQSCPFCGQMHPDEAHLASHKYQQCLHKPESQRTFYRRDHFVQHLHHVHFANTKHPSVRVGCQTQLLATEGHHFGCKDLAMRWRRFGAPMKRDDPMLRCGFCGKRSRDWSERCEHVAQHLTTREHDRSIWWPERKENHLENLYSASPFESFRCRYCMRIFTDVSEMNAHSHCKVWSCRFLKSFADMTTNNTTPHLCPDFPSAKAHHCHLCGAGYRTPHAEHAQQHRYRSCNQEFYTSEDAFLAHLHNFHGSSHPALIQGSSVIEQNFLRNKGASFEPVEFNESWKPCLVDLDNAPIGFAVDKPPTSLSHDKKDHKNVRKQTPVRRIPREDVQQSITNNTKMQRQRSETVASKSEAWGPRFVRLSTHVPSLTCRILYSRNMKAFGMLEGNRADIEEIEKPHIASLVMSSGVVGMAMARWFVKPKLCPESGMVELAVDEVVL